MGHKTIKKLSAGGGKIKKSPGKIEIAESKRYFVLTDNCSRDILLYLLIFIL